MPAIDLRTRLQEAKVMMPNRSTTEVVRMLIATITPDLLDKLAHPPTRMVRWKGKGGNTNYSESLLEKAYKEVFHGAKFHPNGSQQPPDMLFGDEEFEWKSVGNDNSSFMFNDSIPDSLRHYCFYTRESGRVLFLRGDILLLSLDRPHLERTHRAIMRGRREGRSEKSLGFCYPRLNLCVRNFLRCAPSNGYYDYDRSVIWTPVHGSHKKG